MAYDKKRHSISTSACPVFWPVEQGNTCFWCLWPLLSWKSGPGYQRSWVSSHQATWQMLLNHGKERYLPGTGKQHSSCSSYQGANHWIYLPSLIDVSIALQVTYGCMVTVHRIHLLESELPVSCATGTAWIPQCWWNWPLCAMRTGLCCPKPV